MFAAASSEEDDVAAGGAAASRRMSGEGDKMTGKASCKAATARFEDGRRFAADASVLDGAKGVEVIFVCALTFLCVNSF